MSKPKLAQLILPLWALVFLVAKTTDQLGMAWVSVVMMGTLGIYLIIDVLAGSPDD